MGSTYTHRHQGNLISPIDKTRTALKTEKVIGIHRQTRANAQTDSKVIS
jgi:hypothetical protein